MKNVRLYHWLIISAAILFMGLQSFSVAHASEYGDSPHEHDGMVCDITLLHSDDVAVLPPMRPVNIIVDAPVLEYSATIVSAPRLTPQGRAPPPRAPPISIQ